ncbi:MAG: phosphoglycerate dehydrogenase [Planctomycetes bacterium]|nr:phosphoglycerate dehydrogenase [Planctomycetota bacterium]
MSSPAVLITPETLLDQNGPHIDVLREAGFEIRYPKNRELARGGCGAAETVDELHGCSAVIASSEPYTADVIAHADSLRVIARCGVGYDRVDVTAASEHRVAVTITPTANHEAVAEHALALILAIAKSVGVGDRQLRAGGWPRIITRPLRGCTLGILGLGRIGRSMAIRGAALSMRVIASEQFPDETFVAQHNIELVDQDELLARSDYLSLHCPLNDETHGLINRQTLAKMKPDSVLINTARGGLIVEADLIEALNTGPLAAAGLDVFEQEPPSADNPLFKLDNVVVTPHLAGADSTSLQNMATEAAQCIARLSRDDWPEGAVVNDALRESWRWSR